MKPRSNLSALEITELHELLSRRLDAVGVQTQPEVAVRLLEIGGNPNAQIHDFVKVIRTDHALSGRVIKLANSAFFAQRSPVTNVDRACVVLGLERLKCVSMGFSLSRAVNDGGERDLSRRIWGHSLLRACLSSQIAKVTAPTHTAEAFVIGLMLDSGIPLVAKLSGQRYHGLLADNPSPGKLFAREIEHLEFTHVDIVTVLAKRWRFPDVLARPLEQHHLKPADPPRTDTASRLHRISYSAGLVDLQVKAEPAFSPEPISSSTPGMTTVQRLLNLGEQDLQRVVSNTVSEYKVTGEFFSDIAARIENVDDVLDQLQQSLTTMLDDQVSASLMREEKASPTRMSIGGRAVEFSSNTAGQPIAYLLDSTGQRLLTHRIAAGAETAQSLCVALGLDATSEREISDLENAIRALAA